MRHDINQTELVPYIIAEKALNELKIPITDDKVDYLVSKSESLFNTNTHFRSSILDQSKDSRQTLFNFMQHWAYRLTEHQTVYSGNSRRKSVEQK